MADYNRVIMIGNLTRDPELKTLASGQPLCRLGLASNRQFKNRQTGAMVQEVCFIDVDVWGNQAESCKQYLQKGRAVLIEGRLKFDTWQDANGGGNRSKHTIVADRVVFLSSGAGANVGGDMSEMSDMSGDQDAGGGPSSGASFGGARNPGSQLERELLEQIDQIKKKSGAAQAKRASSVTEFDDISQDGDFDQEAGKKHSEKKASSGKRAVKHDDDESSVTSGGVKFQDEPPFEDELPF